MSSYTKVTPREFKKRLSNGRYDNIGGARRSIGRMAEWTDAQRSKARTWVDDYFAKQELQIPSKSISAAKRRVEKRQQRDAKRQAEEAPALQFAKDFQAVKYSKKRAEFRRLLDLLPKLGISPEELAGALA